MALVKCRECGKEVSTKAATCPSCGAPVPKGTSPVTLAVAGVIVGLVLIGVFSGSGNHDQSSSSPVAGSSPPAIDPAVAAASAAAAVEKKAAADAACRTDLQCWGGKHIADADVYCQRPIEKLAKYSVKWTDGFLENKFDHFRWVDERLGVIRFRGDRIQFQNGFGAFQNFYYECDLQLSKEELGKPRIIAIGANADLDLIEMIPIAEANPNGDGVLSVAQLKAATQSLPVPQAEAHAAASPATESSPATVAGPVSNPSFDCAKARSTVELMICADPELGDRDRALAAEYAAAKAVTPDDKQFKEDTRQAWNWREKNCSDKGCLLNWYSEQDQRFAGIVAAARAPAAQPAIAAQAPAGQSSFARPAAPTARAQLDCETLANTMGTVAAWRDTGVPIDTASARVGVVLNRISMPAVSQRQWLDYVQVLYNGSADQVAIYNPVLTGCLQSHAR